MGKSRRRMNYVDPLHKRKYLDPLFPSSLAPIHGNYEAKDRGPALHVDQ